MLRKTRKDDRLAATRRNRGVFVHEPLIIESFFIISNNTVLAKERASRSAQKWGDTLNRRRRCRLKEEPLQEPMEWDEGACGL